ncbi:16S rRNA (adenine(1518)-N(6)/adenine(1519)-N(6))-dimethyltransferase RsmA [Granulosicoccaceae sp. 1_MG-2023]|nr:16S rRNA (adenine(1518)-N(6)/adenine(1519)-N(6))-dimethyltransferase RsmA [Granulosicoccaceae sp. 1_MG-2023]
MHRPRKRFGQNFLHDPNIIRRIVGSIAPQAGDNLLEIGPGQGALTFPVLEACGKLTAIELDRDLVTLLNEKKPANAALTIISQDALKADFSGFGEALRVIGNLPYNISSPLLFHLLGYAAHIRDMHFMLQKEVVDRMTAAPGSKTYGRLSVMIQALCRAEKLFDVPPGAFFPPPAVDSSIVRLVPRDPAGIPAHDPAVFAKVVSQSFSQRRKTLRNNLKGLISSDAMESIGLSPSERAENLSVDDFFRLSALADG